MPRAHLPDPNAAGWRFLNTASKGVRVEKDTMGALEVPADRCALRFAPGGRALMRRLSRRARFARGRGRLRGLALERLIARAAQVLGRADAALPPKLQDRRPAGAHARARRARVRRPQARGRQGAPRRGTALAAQPVRVRTARGVWLQYVEEEPSLRHTCPAPLPCVPAGALPPSWALHPHSPPATPSHRPLASSQHAAGHAGPKAGRRDRAGGNRGGGGQALRSLPARDLADRQRHAVQHERQRGGVCNGR